MPCRSTHSIFAWNSTFHPNIRPPHPSFRASALRRFALQCNERLGVRTQRMSMDIDPRTPHVPLINTEQLLEVEKTSFQYSPDISCMCLLRGLNGHIRVIYLASRQTASSWRPKLPSSSLDAHCPPLEAWYLGCIRIASHAGVYPLTCAEAEGGVSVVWCCDYGRECGHCGCCRAHHRPLLRPLSTPTNSHNRSPTQTCKNILSPPPPLSTSHPL